MSFTKDVTDMWDILFHFYSSLHLYPPIWTMSKMEPMEMKIAMRWLPKNHWHVVTHTHVAISTEKTQSISMNIFLSQFFKLFFAMCVSRFLELDTPGFFR